jgi:hypothetical protein
LSREATTERIASIVRQTQGYEAAQCFTIIRVSVCKMEGKMNQLLMSFWQHYQLEFAVALLRSHLLGSHLLHSLKLFESPRHERAEERSVRIGEREAGITLSRARSQKAARACPFWAMLEMRIEGH